MQVSTKLLTCPYLPISYMCLIFSNFLLGKNVWSESESDESEPENDIAQRDDTDDDGVTSSDVSDDTDASTTDSDSIVEIEEESEEEGVEELPNDVTANSASNPSHSFENEVSTGTCIDLYFEKNFLKYIFESIMCCRWIIGNFVLAEFGSKKKRGLRVFCMLVLLKNGHLMARISQ